MKRREKNVETFRLLGRTQQVRFADISRSWKRMEEYHVFHYSLGSSKLHSVVLKVLSVGFLGDQNPPATNKWSASQIHGVVLFFFASTNTCGSAKEKKTRLWFQIQFDEHIFQTG